MPWGGSLAGAGCGKHSPLAGSPRTAHPLSLLPAAYGGGRSAMLVHCESRHGCRPSACLLRTPTVRLRVPCPSPMMPASRLARLAPRRLLALATSGLAASCRKTPMTCVCATHVLFVTLLGLDNARVSVPDWTDTHRSGLSRPAVRWLRLPVRGLRAAARVAHRELSRSHT